MSQPYDQARAGAVPPGVIRAAIALSMLALLIPILWVRVPPVLDYPNHWARLWLLAGGMDRPPLDAIYTTDWSAAWSNIGIDLLAVTLGRVIGADVLAPLLLAAATILPPLSAAVLNRSLFGGWHWWHAGFAVLAWNATLVTGLLNFQIGLGLALLAAAADSRLAYRGVAMRGAVRAAVGLGLAVMHVFAACFYVALLGALALGRGATAGGLLRAPLAAGRDAVLAALPAGLVLIALIVLAPATPGLGAPAEANPIWDAYSFVGKSVALSSAFRTYEAPLDFGFLVALWVAARIASAGAVIRTHGGLMILVPALLLVAVVMPPALGGTLLLDWRFPVMALLAFAAGVRPEAKSARWAGIATALMLGLALARTGWITQVWVMREPDAMAVQRALSHVPPGAAVLPAVARFDGRAAHPVGRHISDMATSWHLPVLGIPGRQVFVPTLFTARGKQPVRVRAPWHEIANGESQPVLLDFLEDFPEGPFWDHWFGYARPWRTRFDYLLVMNADMTGAELGALERLPLILIADEGFARLYRVRRATGD
ncbi:MAG TPA: hypothetical protein VD970_03090 [Acetobacteraceae bacterium]|nr:hypothetical protein [Acetobacteraceae bacterium]